MKIKFVFTSQISLIAKKNDQSIEVVDNSSIQTAIMELLKSNSQEFKELILDQHDQLLPAILLIKNDDQISFDDKSSLKDGDEIMLFSPMSGG
ncbi:MAG: hypothetical protein COA79_24770 [Planctomycetota bacterium]|nr:MAG: hypothetical protein COA79_24770 [Planctomycetota bacterium]